MYAIRASGEYIQFVTRKDCFAYIGFCTLMIYRIILGCASFTFINAITHMSILWKLRLNSSKSNKRQWQNLMLTYFCCTSCLLRFIPLPYQTIFVSFSRNIKTYVMKIRCTQKRVRKIHILFNNRILH